jgi:PhnB protein
VAVRLCVKDAARFLQFLAKAFDTNVVEKNQAHDEWGPRTATMHLCMPDVDAVYERTLKARATSLSEPKDQFYGERNGGFMDAWGNHGYVATHKESLSEEEVERRAGAQGT